MEAEAEMARSCLKTSRIKFRGNVTDYMDQLLTKISQHSGLALSILVLGQARSLRPSSNASCLNKL